MNGRVGYIYLHAGVLGWGRLQGKKGEEGNKKRSKGDALFIYKFISELKLEIILK